VRYRTRKKTNEVNTVNAYECVECKEVITNPLCPGCLKHAVVQWLGETAPGAVRQFHAAHRKVAVQMGDVICIKCRHKMDLCTHCYGTHVLRWLRKTPDVQNLVEEFLTYFNFELDNTPEEVMP